jgi:hypothetical protein
MIIIIIIIIIMICSSIQPWRRAMSMLNLLLLHQ